MSASVRYFCRTLPAGRRQLAFDYLESIVNVGLSVKLMSVGPAFLHIEPWASVTHLYMAPLADRFINSICVPLDLSLGVQVTAGEAAPNLPQDLQPMPGQAPAQFPKIKKDAQESKKVVYQPRTAFSALYTVGIPNIAFTRAFENQKPSENEIRALALYDSIVVPFETDAKALEAWGLSAVVIHPSESLGPLFSRLSPP